MEVPVTRWTDPEFDAYVGSRMGALVRFAYALTGDLGHAEDLVQAAALHRLLAGLSPRQRAVLALRNGADLPEAEIAELLGVSIGTVKSTASRGLARLRAELDPSRYEGSTP